MFLAHSSIAYHNSALDIHITGPLIHVMNLDIDLDLNSLSSRSLKFSFGSDWSCGPQLASQSPFSPGGNGKLRNECNLCGC